MTNVMKRSNLALPSSGYELDREEMCYVDGGGQWTWRYNDTKGTRDLITFCFIAGGVAGIAAIGMGIAGICGAFTGVGLPIAIAAWAATGLCALAAGTFLNWASDMEYYLNTRGYFDFVITNLWGVIPTGMKIA